MLRAGSSLMAQCPLEWVGSQFCIRLGNPSGHGGWRTLLPMAVIVEMQNTGEPEVQRDVVAMVEHVLSDRVGDWRVVIAGSQGNDQWEMKIFGPNGLGRSYILEGAAEHEPRVIGGIVSDSLPPRS